MSRSSEPNSHQASVLESLQVLLALVENSWPNISSGEIHTIDSALENIVEASHNIHSYISQVDVEIKVERNALIKAVALPVELLEQIFWSVRGDWKSVVAVSQTCSRWRDVVVHDSTMWTYLNLVNVPHQVATMFSQRSGSRTLSLKLAMSLVAHPQLPNFWRDMFCHCEAWRIRKFKIVIPRTLSAYLLSSSAFNSAWITDTEMPLLEELSIVTKELPDSLRTTDFCLQRLLSNTLPNLRSLTLLGVWLPHTWGGYKGLTKLHIKLSGSEPLPFDLNILEVLRESPDLEHIYLSIPFATQTERVLDAIGAPIPLPHIRHAELELLARDMSYLLSSISLPDDLPFLKLQCKSHHLDSILTCLPADPSHLPGLNALTALTVDLYNSQLRICPGPEVTSTPEPRTFVLESVDEPSLGSIISVASKARQLSTLRNEPFYAVYVRGCGVPSLDMECMNEVLMGVPFRHTLGFGGCASDIVDWLHEALGELVLGKLEFYQMEISSEALLRFVLSHKAQIQQLSLLQCVLLAPSAEDASIVLNFLDNLLPGATWYDMISYRAFDMDSSALLPL
ncbi:hypothetical protein EIP86_005336 [Pleurotus ostreatoroseus]|nr:hypothetical protein EIP86_005336 [Pleurotus ostreatoroseus]